MNLTRLRRVVANMNNFVMCHFSIRAKFDKNRRLLLHHTVQTEKYKLNGHICRCVGLWAIVGKTTGFGKRHGSQ